MGELDCGVNSSGHFLRQRRGIRGVLLRIDSRRNLVTPGAQDALHLLPHAPIPDDRDSHGPGMIVRGAREINYPFCDWTRVTTEVLTTSSTEHPRERSLTGFANPWRKGP